MRVSAQFADLGLEFVRQPTPTATQVALDKADWTAVGTAMGRVYQALCDQDNEGVLAALHTIDTILTKHGVLVPQPILRHPPEGAQTHGE